MDENEAKEALRANRVEIDPTDARSYGEIAVALGVTVHTRDGRKLHPMFAMHALRAAHGLAAPDEVKVLREILADPASDAYIIESEHE